MMWNRPAIRAAGQALASLTLYNPLSDRSQISLSCQPEIAVSNIISTIGYEGTDLGQFVRRLSAAGIAHVIDVRDRPISRKPGFSKTALSTALAGSCIAYTHLSALGDPKAGRDAMRAGRYGEFLDIFTAHLDRPEGKQHLVDAAQLARQSPCALLCFEADHHHCHRKLVADRLAQAGAFQVRHLSMRCEPVRRETDHAAGALAFG